MIKAQSNSLSLLLEAFAQPCTKQREALMEQSVEITVE